MHVYMQKVCGFNVPLRKKTLDKIGSRGVHEEKHNDRQGPMYIL